MLLRLHSPSPHAYDLGVKLVLPFQNYHYVMSLLAGHILSLALARNSKRVELRDFLGVRVAVFGDQADDSQAVPVLPTSQIVIYISRGYEVHGSKRRVQYLCPPRPQPFIGRVTTDTRVFDADFEFWAGRSCLRFWADQRSEASVVR